ncbi:helix-turn-helix domain-containing protein [Microbacterium sp. A84]|uniref:helix-turn-helix domain-containing protein n=1 Tax=Microbacterium sp. A84 TaxID=3450715 RepID=UPI003F43F89D
MTIADQLTRLRARKRITATAIGARSGLDPSNIYAVERGRRDPRVSTIENYARALGATFLVVNTEHRSGAADTAEAIRQYLDSDDTHSAAQALVQLVASIRALPPLGKIALTYAPPASVDPRWDSALAGIVETELLNVGLPFPEWVEQIIGDPSWSWDPWTDGALTLDGDEVSEPLRRRGILIGADELASA